MCGREWGWYTFLYLAWLVRAVNFKAGGNKICRTPGHNDREATVIATFCLWECYCTVEDTSSSAGPCRCFWTQNSQARTEQLHFCSALALLKILFCLKDTLLSSVRYASKMGWKMIRTYVKLWSFISRTNRWKGSQIRVNTLSKISVPRIMSHKQIPYTDTAFMNGTAYSNSSKWQLWENIRVPAPL